ncbi:hypothetical protein L1887_55550 [Cichorium endivia]|nr:hypothetical protein L1887_55550 [Cichorium endivia]
MHRYRPKSREQPWISSVHNPGGPGRIVISKRSAQPGPSSVHNPGGPGRIVISKRSPDSRTTTVTASGNDTVTVTARASTQTTVVATTNTIPITALPKTVNGNNVTQTVTEPAPTKMITEIVYSQKYVLEALGVVCTSTVTSTPAALKRRSARGKEGILSSDVRQTASPTRPGKVDLARIFGC